MKWIGTWKKLKHEKKFVRYRLYRLYRLYIFLKNSYRWRTLMTCSDTWREFKYYTEKDDRPPDQKSKFFIETKEVGLSARRKTLTSIYIITEYIPDIKFIIS